MKKNKLGKPWIVTTDWAFLFAVGCALFLVLLFAGCSPPQSEAETDREGRTQYRMGDLRKVTEFETMNGTPCVMVTGSYGSVALSCDWNHDRRL